MKSITLFLLLTSFAVAQAQHVRLAWDHPRTNNETFNLYASTNSVTEHGLTNAAVKVNVGTNLTATMQDFTTSGRWYFVATARNQAAESLPSNEVVADIPAPPEMLRTVFLQYTTSLTNGWADVGFFKVRIE